MRRFRIFPQTPANFATICSTGQTLRKFIVVCKNGQDIRLLEGLQTPVTDADEVQIIASVAGG